VSVDAEAPKGGVRVKLLIAFIVVVVAGLTWLTVHDVHQRSVEKSRCEANGGVYIDARDYHKCLYGVKTTP
jgi:hypothetical protein